MDSARFERLVRGTAYRPAGVPALRAELRRQTHFHPDPTEEGLEPLAEAVASALQGRTEEADRALATITAQVRHQPLGHYYRFALRYAGGDRKVARESLEALLRLDPGDPIGRMHALHLDGEALPEITEEDRLANIRKLGAAPLLKNAYQLAVGAIFQAIRRRTRARVLDVGVGSGAQMMELLALLDRRDHSLRRVELVGLDFVDDFLETAGRNVTERAAELSGVVEVSYEPVKGRIEGTDPDALRRIAGEDGVDVVNASITLHEVPGAAKAAALGRIRELDPARFVLVEWNYCLENVFAPGDIRFLFNVRRLASDWVAALRRYYPLDEAREVVRVVLSQAGGQITCPAEERQECYLDPGCWKALLEATGFEVADADSGLRDYADTPELAGVGAEPWYLAPYRDGAVEPLALLEAVVRPG